MENVQYEIEKIYTRKEMAFKIIETGYSVEINDDDDRENRVHIRLEYLPSIVNTLNEILEKNIAAGIRCNDCDGECIRIKATVDSIGYICLDCGVYFSGEIKNG